jgi:hypothetical protein
METGLQPPRVLRCAEERPLLNQGGVFRSTSGILSLLGLVMSYNMFGQSVEGIKMRMKKGEVIRGIAFGEATLLR